MIRKFLLAVAMSLSALAMAAQAGATVIVSGAGNTACILGPTVGGGSCTTQAINAHPRWQADNPNGLGAVWVSYADTGQPGSVRVPSNSSTPIMTVTESFTLGTGGGLLNFEIWADDTADVYVDGVQLFAANFSQNICADGIIGCEPGEQGVISNYALGAGSHNITMSIYQIGVGPFGLLYSGTVSGGGSPQSVPEPATALIFSVGLLGLGMARRKRRG